MTLKNADNNKKTILQEIYNRAFERKALDYAQSFVYDPESLETRQKMKQLLLYGIRASESNSGLPFCNIIDISLHVVMVDYLYDLLTEITPGELANVFPIDKSFDRKGQKGNLYFSTMQRLHEIGLNNPIGNRINEILSNYMNQDIIKYCSVKNEISSYRRLLENF